MRTLTITAAEWASGQDGTLWLAWEQDALDVSDMTGAALNDGGFACSRFYRSGPPVGFALACAPCDHDVLVDGVEATYRTCPDCRIELVGPCLGRNQPDHVGFNCPSWCTWGCNGTGTVTLGHAYAVGQPLPIREWDEVPIGPSPCLLVGTNEDDGNYRFVMLEAGTDSADLTDRLAHYGPPESLVGKWALRLEVVGP